MAMRVNLQASDLGVELSLDAWHIDAWCTRAVVTIVEAPFSCAVASARLVAQRVERGDLYPLATLPLVAARPRDGGTELLFGALPADATHATLRVTRLRVGDDTPSDAPAPRAFDPFDLDDPACDASACARFLEAEDDDRSLPPEWECRGEWAYDLTVPPPPADGLPSTRTALPVLVDVGPCAVAVPWVDVGESASLLAVDVVNRDQARWGALWKDVALGEERTAVPAARLTINQRGEPWSGEPLGPYGRLGARLYFEGPPIDGPAELGVGLEGLLGVALSPPSEHTFAAHSFEQAPTFDIDLATMGLDGQLRITLHDVHGNDGTFLLMYRADLSSTDIGTAWLSDVTLIDSDNVEHVCQEDGTQPLRDFGLEAPPGVRAMRFGGIRAEEPVTLRVGALDIWWRSPRSIVAPGSTVEGETAGA